MISTESKIQKVHYKFFYEPVHQTQAKEESILLDILFEKAAYASMLIKHGTEKFEKFSNPMELKDWTIKEPLWIRLNRLKKSNPEAFFYWYKIHELMTQSN